MWSRKSLGDAAREIADHLQLIEHVKALQTGQKELGAAIATLGDRLRAIETDLAVLRAEVKLDALREAQSVVYAVQGGLNQQIQDLAVRMAVHETPGHARLPPSSDA